MKPWSSLVVGLSIVLAIGYPAFASIPHQQPQTALTVVSAPSTEHVQQRARQAYAQLPLSFVPNKGQIGAAVRYQAQRGSHSFAFGAAGATLAFARGDHAAVLDMRFEGALGSAGPVGERQGPGTVNYFIGDDPARWLTDLPTYEQLRYAGLWPGIDLVFRGEGGKLEYELLVGPGANVADIRLAYGGADALSIDHGGDLRIATPHGVITDARPVSYQDIAGARVPVQSRFTLGTDGTYGFAVDAYDASQPLVIDPGLVYSTFLGGTSGDVGLGIAVDAAGSAYVTGATPSANFPTTGGAFDTTFNSGQDVFVTKLNASGTALVYSTFIGGSSNDQGFAIALDSSGSAYVTGSTGSSNYPRQSGLPPFVYQQFYGGGSTDAFVTKLSPSGANLVFSTYAGGFGADQGFGIAVHPSADVYVTGDTRSPNLRFTPNALQKTRKGSSDAFFLRLDRFAAAAGYMSYLGGNADDSARAIAIDAARNVYLTGGTTSADFPTTGGAFDTTANGSEDVFVTKLRFDGGAPGSGDVYALGYSTFLGGGGLDRGLGLALDTGGNTYVTGITASSGGTPFPTTAGAIATTYQGGSFDAFVTKLNATGTAPLAYSTYLGGTGDDRGQGIAVGAAGVATLTGRTNSANFPSTPGAFDPSWNLGDDAFVTKLGVGGGLVYSTFLGGVTGPGGNNDRGMAIALDGGGGTYVTGLANASDFPTTPGAYDTTNNGLSDAFVTKLITVGAPFTLTLAPATDTNQVGNPHTVTATVTDFGAQPVPGVTVRFAITGANSASGSCVTGTNGQCTFTYTGTIAGPDTINAFADTNDNGTQGAGEPSGVATKTWTPGPPATLTLAPATATNVVGFTHCVTATVRDVFGNVVPGVNVIFSIPNATTTNASPASASATTNASGQAQFCFTATLPGTNLIHAFADTNNNGTQDATAVPPEPFADATKNWFPPASACDVTVTVGGWIVASNGDKATFGGTAQVSDGAVKGQQTYQDHGPAAPRDVKSIELLALICDPAAGTASIFGTATIDGSGTFFFRIDLVDMGEPGTEDRYGITLSDGYASGLQPLQGGNVKIHK